MTRTIEQLGDDAHEQRRAWLRTNPFEENPETFSVTQEEYHLILHHLPPLWVALDSHGQLTAYGMKLSIVTP